MPLDPLVERAARDAEPGRRTFDVPALLAEHSLDQDALGFPDRRQSVLRPLDGNGSRFSFSGRMAGM